MSLRGLRKRRTLSGHLHELQRQFAEYQADQLRIENEDLKGKTRLLSERLKLHDEFTSHHEKLITHMFAMPFEPDNKYCVGLWLLDHNGYHCKDSSGYAHHGIWHADVKLMQGVSNGFETTLYPLGDGRDRYVLIEDSPLLQLSKASIGFSIFVRIYPTDLSDTDPIDGPKYRYVFAKNDDYIFNNDDGPANDRQVQNGFALAVTSDGTLRFTLRQNGNNYTVESLSGVINVTTPATPYEITIRCISSLAPQEQLPPPSPDEPQEPEPEPLPPVQPPGADDPVPEPEPDPTITLHKFVYPNSAISSEGDDGNIDDNVNDGNRKTRWSYQPTPAWIKFDLGSRKTVRVVKIAWFRGDERRFRFNIKTADEDEQIPFFPVSKYTQRYEGRSTGRTKKLEAYNVQDSQCQYVLINVKSNTMNDWASITEVEIWGTEIPIPVDPPSDPPSPPPVPAPPTETPLPDPEPPQLELSVDRIFYAITSTNHLNIPEDSEQKLMLYGNYPYTDTTDSEKWYKWKGGIQHLLMYRNFHFTVQHIENIVRNRVTIQDIQVGGVAFAGMSAVFGTLQGPGGYDPDGFDEVGFDVGYQQMTIGDFGGFDPTGFDNTGFDVVDDSTAHK